MHGIEYGVGYVNCSFCGERGHNITSCTKVAEVYNSTDYDIKTHYHDGTPLPADCHPWAKINNWNGLGGRARKAYIEMENRKKRKAKKASSTTKRKKPRCSFCRKFGHRRPSCKHKKKFAKTVYKANSLWRKCLMDHVSDVGMGIGALIKVPTSMLYWAGDHNDSILCMITDYSFDRMHVFCAHKERDDWRTSPYMVVTDTMSGSEYKLHLDKLTIFINTPLIHSRGWGSHTIDVVSPVKWKPSEKWLNTDSNDELEYLIKKISVDDHSFHSVNKLINTWNVGGGNE